MVSVHRGPGPEQSPWNPEKASSSRGVAINVTVDPDAKVAVQWLPQLIPVGELVTDPPYAFALSTVRVCPPGEPDA